LIRAEAIKRTDHLGLAELDTDFDPNGSLHLTAGRDALPETFRRHLPSVGRKTVKEEMTPEQAAAIKLFGLTEDCMSTLCDILVETGGDNPPFSRRQLSSLDCLAFGYLSLMRDAPVPRSFLKDWMTQKASRLSIFVDDMKLDYLQNLDDLPFDTSPPATALDISVRTLDSALLNVPEVGVRYAKDKRVRAEDGTTGYLNGRSLALVTCMVAGVALVYARQVYMALPPFGARTQAWNRHQGTRLSEYGDLGFMMQNLGPVYSPPASMSAPTGRVVQTDSEVD
jgi:sorting and assembly machinery component 37